MIYAEVRLFSDDGKLLTVARVGNLEAGHCWTQNFVPPIIDGVCLLHAVSLTSAASVIGKPP